MDETVKSFAIILAGGSGLRAGGEIPKQYALLEGKPVIAYSMSAFQNNGGISGIIVVASPEFFSRIKKIADDFKITKLIKIVSGGKERKDSSLNGLKALDCRDSDIVLIHDAARPFIDDEIIDGCINKVLEHGAAGVYIKSVDTIAIASGDQISEIPDRTNCYCAQTPQGFTYRKIMDAHTKAPANEVFTDDVSLLLGKGEKISIAEGKASNFKITNPDDFKRAVIFLSQNIQSQAL